MMNVLCCQLPLLHEMKNDLVCLLFETKNGLYLFCLKLEVSPMNKMNNYISLCIHPNKESYIGCIKEDEYVNKEEEQFVLFNEF